MTACDKELSNILKQGSNYFLISKPILLESAGAQPKDTRSIQERPPIKERKRNTNPKIQKY
jgi:hypothetical protein